jgi:hypothetical protein
MREAVAEDEDEGDDLPESLTARQLAERDDIQFHRAAQQQQLQSDNDERGVADGIKTLAQQPAARFHRQVLPGTIACRHSSLSDNNPATDQAFGDATPDCRGRFRRRPAQ